MTDENLTKPDISDNPVDAAALKRAKRQEYRRLPHVREAETAYRRRWQTSPEGRVQRKLWYAKNADKLRAIALRKGQQRRATPEGAAANRAASRRYRSRNIDKINARIAADKITNPDRYREYNHRAKPKRPARWAAYYTANRERLIREAMDRNKHRRQSDPIAKLRYALRSRFARMLKSRGMKKPASVIALVGCSIDELRAHLENLFLPGMSWDNYGFRGWHIDHIRPLAAFDLASKEAVAKACHYTNLQPLWAKDNFAKGAKF